MSLEILAKHQESTVSNGFKENKHYTLVSFGVFCTPPSSGQTHGCIIRVQPTNYHRIFVLFERFSGIGQIEFFQFSSFDRIDRELDLLLLKAAEFVYSCPTPRRSCLEIGRMQPGSVQKEWHVLVQKSQINYFVGNFQAP